MPKQRTWQEGDICYQTGLNWRSLIHLIRPRNGREGHYLTEVKIMFRRDGVLMVLKKDSPTGPKVAFIETEHFDSCVWVLKEHIVSKQVQWKPDKFRSIRNDK